MTDPSPSGTDDGASSPIKDHWITALALIAAALQVFLCLAAVLTSDPEYQDEDRVVSVITGIGATALLVGLWGIRSRRLPSRAANTLIVIGAVATALWFWLFLIPGIVGAALIYFGVMKGGLERELHPE